MKATEEKIDNKKMKFLKLQLRAFDHKIRRKVIELIDLHIKIDVTSLYLILKVDQAVMSQHLAVLRESRFVEYEKEGRFVYYSINKKVMEGFVKHVNEYNNKL